MQNLVCYTARSRLHLTWLSRAITVMKPRHSASFPSTLGDTGQGRAMAAHATASLGSGTPATMWARRVPSHMEVIWGGAGRGEWRRRPERAATVATSTERNSSPAANSGGIWPGLLVHARTARLLQTYQWRQLGPGSTEGSWCGMLVWTMNSCISGSCSCRRE